MFQMRVSLQGGMQSRPMSRITIFRNVRRRPVANPGDTMLDYAA